MAIPSKDDVTVKLGSEPVATPTAGRTVAEAAIAAAEAFAPDEIEKHAQAIADAWVAKLTIETKAYTKQLAMLAKTVKTEAAEPFTGAYQWWNLLLAGPFQNIAAGVGPFRPHKIISADEPCFFVVALWRNPAPLGNGPSAAAIMAGFNYRLWLQCSNINAMTPGPNVAIPGVANWDPFGANNINIRTHIYPANAFAAVDGHPTLYEMNALVDIQGPGGGLPPFAGYSTWVLDPDYEAPFLIPPANPWPPIPIPVPGRGPRLQHDIPARFLVYD